MLVKLKNVDFHYRSKKGRTQALRGVDFELSKGRICGLLGPNGAGKTTLIRCASGLMRPESGTVELFGSVPLRKNSGRIGVLAENPGVYRRLRGEEFLRYFGELYGTGNIKERISELAGTFRLDFLQKHMGALSVGQKQKIHLARSLLNNPSLVLWDEPFSNLDPVSQKMFQNYLREYVRANDAAAVIATHQLSQAEESCTDLAFISGGEIIHKRTAEEVQDELKKESNIEISLLPASDTNLLQKVLEGFGLKSSILNSGAKNDNISAVLSGAEAEDKIPDVIAALTVKGLKLTGVKTQKKSMYDYYCGLIKA